MADHVKNVQKKTKKKKKAAKASPLEELPPPFQLPGDLPTAEAEVLEPISTEAHWIILNALVNFYHRDGQGRVMVWTDKKAAEVEGVKLNELVKGKHHLVTNIAGRKWKIFQKEMSYVLMNPKRTSEALEESGECDGDAKSTEATTTKPATEHTLLLQAPTGSLSPFTIMLKNQVQLKFRPHHCVKLVLLRGVTKEGLQEAIAAEVMKTGEEGGRENFDITCAFQKFEEKAQYIHKGIIFNRKQHRVTFSCPLDYLMPFKATDSGSRNIQSEEDTVVVLLDADTGLPLYKEWLLSEFRVPAWRCGYCKKQSKPSETAEKLWRCGGCGLVPYCSKGCQKKHWKAKAGNHKAACTNIKSLHHRFFEGSEAAAPK